MITKEQYLEAIKNMAESVYDFHDRFHVPQISLHEDTRTILAMLSSRLLLQMEEVGEFSADVSKSRWLDAGLETADVLYVALGSILSIGSDGISACNEIAAKNNKKTPLNSKVGLGGKIIGKN